MTQYILWDQQVPTIYDSLQIVTCESIHTQPCRCPLSQMQLPCSMHQANPLNAQQYLNERYLSQHGLLLHDIIRTHLPAGHADN